MCDWINSAEAGGAKEGSTWLKEMLWCFESGRIHMLMRLGEGLGRTLLSIEVEIKG